MLSALACPCPWSVSTILAQARVDELLLDDSAVQPTCMVGFVVGGGEESEERDAPVVGIDTMLHEIEGSREWSWAGRRIQA